MFSPINAPFPNQVGVLPLQRLEVLVSGQHVGAHDHKDPVKNRSYNHFDFFAQDTPPVPRQLCYEQKNVCRANRSGVNERNSAERQRQLSHTENICLLSVVFDPAPERAGCLACCLETNNPLANLH